MSERDPGNNKSPNQEPIPSPNRKRAISYGVAAGVFTGGAFFLGANALGNHDSLQVGEIVFSITSAGVAGRIAQHISLHEAENLREEGDITRMRLKIAQACFENSLFYSLANGAILLNTLGIGAGIVGAGMGAALGSGQAIEEWRKRTKEFPSLVVPIGNSTYRDYSFPDKSGGFKMPPVFIAESISDFQEFRRVNKERIMSWSLKIPSDIPGENHAFSRATSETPLLTSVMILPNIRHYPAMDPEDNINDIRLMDDNDFVIASPIQRTEAVWSEPTIFEEVVAGVRTHHKSEWQRWRNKSWRSSIALLVQYRNTDKSISPFKRIPLDKIVDKYWLLDIFSQDDGDNNEEEIQRAKAPSAIPVLQT